MYILQVLSFFMLIFANEYQFIVVNEKVDQVNPEITNHYIKRHADSSLVFLIFIALINIAVNIYIIRYRFVRAIEGGSSR